MKKIFIIAIRIYQLFLSPLMAPLSVGGGGCRFEISCSEYTIQAIQSLGVVRGTYRGMKRILSCHP